MSKGVAIRTPAITATRIPTAWSVFIVSLLVLKVDKLIIFPPYKYYKT